MNDEAIGLLDALEDERRYVARELHDGVAQTTLQLGLQVGICRKLLERGNLEMLGRELANLEERIQVAAQQVRDIISDMRPPLVEPGAGLAEYLNLEIELHHQHQGSQIIHRLEGVDKLPPLSQTQILALARVAQEALLNIRKHAQASQVFLSLEAKANSFYLIIADNGKGFDPAEVAQPPADKGGAGLANLRRRIEAIGGSLSITSVPDKGTEVSVKLP